MDIAVLGTGHVGRTLATKLVAVGHSVTMGGAPAAGRRPPPGWRRCRAGRARPGGRGRQGSFADAAAAGEVIVNATAGAHSLEALDQAGATHLGGKIVIDVSNPLDFSQGFPPALTVGNTDSLGEQIQRAFPDAHVVKTLNTVAAEVMVDPTSVPGGHTLFLCGDDPGSKAVVIALLGDLGWPSTDVVDLGDITACRGTEAYVLLWVRLIQAVGTRRTSVRVVSA